MRKIVFALFVCVAMAGHAFAAPVITFYKKQGESNVDCRITMGNGTVNFKSSSNACTNDDDYYFSVSGAQDGVQFGIYNNPDCRTNESYATYKMGNGDASGNIRITAVDASRGLSSGTLIHDSLRSGGASGGGQLHGKVSCLKVTGMRSSEAMQILPK
ncbi:hypothetical protein DF107_23810 [Burkholderia stagnalis]|uniref:Uncharacterized protein n=1 Tax=Burkholderia stagnalis TaxID=1503054 RepID=A0A108KTA3_9BURK|nr:hypothetical protein [Burkholderia stagnalis]AOK55076.1 hypothetical protein WT74_20075 [Burkholderia stagnalis]KAB0639927.1 hypothetical protein F7R25_06315 [Burkholderia stagnalis]KVC59121.1 hypothetical protein WS59_21720 [Burkholderia stagnalis]KVL87811.1 hypothetical protein WT02_27540 [Burkholderia stagnalis]KVM03494.1 hypothetical protein WT04_27330 [Burkholderia stagnalis]